MCGQVDKLEENIDEAAQQAIATVAATSALQKGDASYLSSQILLQISTDYALPLRDLEIAALAQQIWPERYLRNTNTLSTQEQISLLTAHVVLVGLGGLGGQILDQLLRLGIGHITAADGDIFEASNLNRQLLSDLITIGKSKAAIAQAYALRCNPAITLCILDTMLVKEDLPALLTSQTTKIQPTILIDALGGLALRQELQEAASNAGIVLISGAVAGWSGIVATVLPHSVGPATVLTAGWNPNSTPVEDTTGTLAPTVAFAAALMATKVVTVLTRKPLQGNTQIFDLAGTVLESVSLA